jgi:diguanylate cyclase (GGDEF)-like protein
MNPAARESVACAFSEATIAVRDALATTRPPLSIALLDVAGVGLVNQRFGQSGGDVLLRAFEDWLHVHTERGETVWRLGGDEYLLLMPHRSARSSTRRLKSLHRRMGSEAVRLTTMDSPVQTSLIAMSFHAGGATAPPTSCTAWGLYGMAGRALQQAERRNRLIVWA